MGLGIATGVKCSGNAPLTVTYLGTNPTGLAIGPARSDRIVVAIGYGENDAGGAMSAVTFNGVGGTILYNPTLSDSFGMAYKFVTTGTTCDVAITQYGLIRTEFYMITGVKTGFYAGAAGWSPAAVGTPNKPSVVIMGARNRSSSGSFSAYATGAALSFQLDHGFNHAGGGNPAIWAASGYGDSSGGTFNANVTGTLGDPAGYAAVFY